MKSTRRMAFGDRNRDIDRKIEIESAFDTLDRCLTDHVTKYNLPATTCVNGLHANYIRIQRVVQLARIRTKQDGGGDYVAHPKQSDAHWKRWERP